MEALFYETSTTRRMKMLSRPGGFMLYGKLWLDFFSTSEVLYPNRKHSLSLIKSRPHFNMVSANANVSPGNVGCSFYTRCVAHKNDYLIKRKDTLAYTPREYNHLETFAKTFITASRKKTSFLGETFLTMLQFFELPLQ